MPFSWVETPVKAPEAFQQMEGVALLTQAATLLLIGAQLRDDAGTLETRTKKLGLTAEWVPSEDMTDLGVPTLLPAHRLFDIRTVHAVLEKRYRLAPPKPLPGPVLKDLPPDILSDLAKSFFREPAEGTATNLVEACLRHPDDLVRVAAAAAHLERSPDAARLEQVLEQGIDSKDEIVQAVAATGLAKLNPKNARLADLEFPAKADAAGAGSSHTTLIVQGTWARRKTWWQPGGDFHNYLTGILPGLSRTPLWDPPYAMRDRFDWSGGYDDAKRSRAAGELVEWVNNHSAQGLDLFAHSHGGNVAMLANHRGLKIGELVLLSCPVHPDKYFPNFVPPPQVGRVVSFHVHMDLVILADGGGQRFHDPQIEENILRGWFLGHSDTHSVQVWSEQSLPSRI